ncbi:hypothetical protein BJ742DRAFT_332942 [Cladochytrium replicatum]|nr:hypothetical protein BJ742DRAFT_332942 [Cladochytrium replicatum]
MIAPLLIRVLLIPAFILRQMRAPHPLVSFALLKDRGVWGGYRSPRLSTARDTFKETLSSPSLSSLSISPLQMHSNQRPHFVGHPTSPGTSNADGASQEGVIAAQVVFGVPVGLVPYPALASVQAVTEHENMAVVTGPDVASYSCE